MGNPLTGMHDTFPVPCAVEYQETATKGMHPAPDSCWCGMFSVARCSNCSRPLCGRHLAGSSLRVLCSGCFEFAVAADAEGQKADVEGKKRAIADAIAAVERSSDWGAVRQILATHPEATMPKPSVVLGWRRLVAAGEFPAPTHQLHWIRISPPIALRRASTVTSTAPSEPCWVGPNVYVFPDGVDMGHEQTGVGDAFLDRKGTPWGAAALSGLSYWKGNRRTRRPFGVVAGPHDAEVRASYDKRRNFVTVLRPNQGVKQIDNSAIPAGHYGLVSAEATLVAAVIRSVLRGSRM
jgi:hypothetical protein